MLWRNKQKYMQASGIFAIALVFCLSCTAPLTAQTEIKIWDETIIVRSNDRMVLQVDGRKFRLPLQAEQVPAHPVDQVAVMFFGAAGDLEHLASGVEINLPNNREPFFRRNCFVYDHIALPTFIPPGLERADTDFLNGCIVASVSFGPGVKSNSRFLKLEAWNDGNLVTLTASPPKTLFPSREVTPLTIEQSQEINVVGTAIEGLYFLTHMNSGPDFKILFEMDGPLFGPGMRLMECDGGYFRPQIFGHDCRISALSEARGAFINIRVYCPCKQDLGSGPIDFLGEA
jgi:hypothetical protein